MLSNFRYFSYFSLRCYRNPPASQALALAQKCQELSWHRCDWWWWCRWHWWPLPATAHSWCDCQTVTHGGDRMWQDAMGCWAVGGITGYLSQVRSNPLFPQFTKPQGATHGQASACLGVTACRLRRGVPGKLQPWLPKLFTRDTLNDRLQHVCLSTVKNGTAKLRRPRSVWTDMLCHEVRQATCKGSVLKGSRGGCLSATAPIVTHRIYALADQYNMQ